MASLEVFADISCPFAHVGLRALVTQRQARALDHPTLVVRAWPLEVVNGTPHSGRHLAPEIAALRDEVAPHLFTGFDAERFPASTLGALAAAAAAHRLSPDDGERFSLLVRDALWERGLDLSDPAVLAALADEAGVPHATAEDEAQVQADLTEGQARGVVGSPHFFTHRGDFFCPALDIHHEGDRWEVRYDREGFQAFLDAALS